MGDELSDYGKEFTPKRHVCFIKSRRVKGKWRK